MMPDELHNSHDYYVLAEELEDIWQENKDLSARIAELEYNAANNAMSIHAILSALDINDETRGVSDDMYDDALGLAFKLTARINELENRIKERDITIRVLMQVIEHLESQLPKEKENEHTEQ